jgi:hypothetical protein
MKRILASLFPILVFGCFPALSLYAENRHEASFAMIIDPILFILGFGLIVWLFLFLLFRDPTGASTVVTVFLLLSFSFRHISNAINQPYGNDVAFGIWIAGLVGGIWAALVPRVAKPLFRTISVAALVLAALTVFRVAWSQSDVQGNVQQTEQTIESLGLDSSEATAKPDVYFIIFDRYANAESLRRYVKYDNTDFLNTLKGKGFSIDNSSRSNYPITLYSVSSTLNLNYHDDLTEKYGRGRATLQPLFEELKDHLAGRLFKSQGYQYLHLGSWWTPTRTSPIADQNLTLTTTSDITRMIYETSVFSDIATRFKFSAIGFRLFRIRQVHALQSQHQFATLKRIPENPNPTFTFAHVLLPHRPYVFREDGSTRSYDEASGRPGTDNYRDQLIYANGQILDLVDEIIKKSDTPPIIIMEADEGPYPDRYVNNEDEFGPRWTDSSDEELRMKTGVLNAWYVPESLRGDLRLPHTPVNTFREIFRLLFHADVPALPDVSYIFPDRGEAYNFIDVTDRVTKEVPDCSDQEPCPAGSIPGIEGDRDP